MATALGYSPQLAAFYHVAHAVGHHASSIVMYWQRYHNYLSRTYRELAHCTSPIL
ncbi:hypothetical protein [Aeromonas veronii]|uniref:hypothetical protein n=1 Tax=Aeromonas veronii TaxID=654 RepID=UPI003006F668